MAHSNDVGRELLRPTHNGFLSRRGRRYGKRFIDYARAIRRIGGLHTRDAAFSMHLQQKVPYMLILNPRTGETIEIKVPRPRK